MCLRRGLPLAILRTKSGKYGRTESQSGKVRISTAAITSMKQGTTAASPLTYVIR